ncbi:MAG: DNA-binding response OmpR family regulator [Candidatus Azotimanducaceae bacterium]|jgi:DNA-binding response OmpR family regulator
MESTISGPLTETPSITHEPPSESGVSILVLERDKGNEGDFQTVAQILSGSVAADYLQSNLTFFNCQTLKEAESILYTQSIHLVLLDLHLAGGQGRLMVKRLSSRFTKTPFVAMTDANDKSAEINELMLEGVQDIICKGSMGGDVLSRCIQDTLERQKLLDKREALSLSNAELTTGGDIACNDLTYSGTASPIKDLRTFTEQLENSLVRARHAVNPDNADQLDRRQALLAELSEQMPSAIQMIRDSLNDMNSLSSGIRTLSELDDRNLQFEALDIGSIVKDMIKTNRAYIETNHVDIHIGELQSVIADRNSIKEIFQGIFDNALKYLDPRREGVIKISSHRDLTYTTFMIRDNGRGIPDEEQDRVFEVFKRGDDVLNISGNGMGMPYVRALVRRHRGIVWFETQPGKGTVFYFTVDNSLFNGPQDNSQDRFN